MVLYHSHLLINVGDDPDRPDWNIGRKWIRNIYRVHQRLCMAFPPKPVPKEPRDWEQRAAAYCKPFTADNSPFQQDLPGPCDGHGPDEDDPPQVHQPRNGNAGFLFRIDYPLDPLGRSGRRPVIVVQSATEPDWDYAFGLTPGSGGKGKPRDGNAGYLLAAPPQCSPVTVEIDGDRLVLDRPGPPCGQSLALRHCEIRSGDLVRFRLRANPTSKRDGKRKRLDPRPQAIAESHSEWMHCKLGPAVSGPICLHELGPVWTYGWRTKHEPQPAQRMQFWSVLFEGRFRVGDIAALRECLISGIGPAKAFGFGLLSLARS